MKSALLIADGLAIPLKQLLKLCSGAFVIALDGAAERARKEGWKPNLILGDLDTLSRQSQAYFHKKKVPILHTPDQNFSDLEKGLLFLIKNGFQKITVAQFWGERIDHSFAALLFLKKFHRRIVSLDAVTKNHRLSYLENQSKRFSGKKNGFAILPFPKCKVWSQGLEYEMEGVSLSIGKLASTSNRALKKNITIKVQGAALIMEEI